jgi:hypothetical protein
MLNECSKLAAYLGLSAHRGPSDSEKLGRKCTAGLSTLMHEVRIKRINKETFRQQINRARFVNVPVLKMKDGTARIPLKYQAKHLRSK